SADAPVTTVRDSPAAVPTPGSTTTMNDEYLVVRAPDGGSQGGRDYVTLGGAEQLREQLTGATAALAAVRSDRGVRLDRSFYGRVSWSLCLGSTDVSLLATNDGGANHLESCEKTGVWVLVLPWRERQWLYVGSRSAMRPEVAAYVDALLAPDRHAEARRLWRGFLAEHRAAGTQPLY
ncbi:MAG: hypothetical protein JWM90_2970, partial [Thermoleophilia bacterium]|nr:hypothetical protein [Thermoleophilia bacterium]